MSMRIGFRKLLSRKCLTTLIFMKVLVIYESTRGRTKAMAEAICEGVIDKGKNCTVLPAENFAGLENVCVLAVGSSTRMKRPLPKVRNLLSEIELRNGLAVFAFGSYGWSGEAPDMIMDALKERGGIPAIETPLKVKDQPSEIDLKKCNKIGGTLSDLCVE
ncbi:MAG: hypothetical protein GF411_08125 [Candidatus Lokiarchaeota archaeon]|nr:hypothetical protein [Candidatus Lokiarchaeota archaeon]